MDDPTSSYNDDRKYDFLRGHIEALRDAFEEACPDDQLLVCVRHVVPTENGNFKYANLFTHTRINDLELAKAIYDWAHILHDSSEEEEDDSNSSWVS